MRAGRLDRKVTVERRTADTSDPYGTVLYTWAPLVTLRAELIEPRVEEFLRGDQGTTIEAHRVFRTRYYDGLTTADRVLYLGELHDVVAVKEIGRKRGLELRCVRRTDDAGA